MYECEGGYSFNFIAPDEQEMNLQHNCYYDLTFMDICTITFADNECHFVACLFGGNHLELFGK